MQNWKEVLEEIHAEPRKGSNFVLDIFWRKYLQDS